MTRPNPLLVMSAALMVVALVATTGQFKMPGGIVDSHRELELLRDDYEALKLEHDDLARRYSRCKVMDEKRRERP